MTKTGKPSMYTTTKNCIKRLFKVISLYNLEYYSFFYKNFLFLDLKRPRFCLSCNLEDETPLHLFFDCHTVQSLWTQLGSYFSDDFRLPTLSLQSALFGLFNDNAIAENVSLINHILLIFKLCINKSTKKHSLNLNYIIANIRIVKTLEKRIASVSDRNGIRNGML